MSTRGAEFTTQQAPAPEFVTRPADRVEDATFARETRATLDFTERRWLLLVGDAFFALIGGAVAVMAWNITSGSGTATLSASRSLWKPILLRAVVAAIRFRGQ